MRDKDDRESFSGGIEMNQDESVNREEPEVTETGTGQSEPATVKTESGGGIERREWLKGLAGIPVVGWLFWRAFRKKPWNTMIGRFR